MPFKITLLRKLPSKKERKIKKVDILIFQQKIRIPEINQVMMREILRKVIMGMSKDGFTQDKEATAMRITRSKSRLIWSRMPAHINSS